MIRAREAGMLTRERMDRMLSAPSYQEAAKLLCDCGYEDMSACSASGVDEALSRRRAEVFAEMANMAPHSEVVDIFRVKYDYHNLKTLVKARAVGADASHILSGCGRVAADKLAEYTGEEGGLSSLPADMAEAYTEAVEILNRTGNPQLADFVKFQAAPRELRRNLNGMWERRPAYGWLKTMSWKYHLTESIC